MCRYRCILTAKNVLTTSDKYGERLFFTYTGSDGVERELTHGGAARRVTFNNRWTFCRMVEEARTHEFDVQVIALVLFPVGAYCQGYYS